MTFITCMRPNAPKNVPLQKLRAHEARCYDDQRQMEGKGEPCQGCPSIKTALEPAVRLITLGGLGEIGLNMMLIEFGDDLIAVDCGLMFPDDELPGVDYVIPDFTYLRARRDAFRGVVLTHGHEDHVGALPYLLREMQVPVYGTALTLALVGEKLREHGLLETAD